MADQHSSIIYKGVTYEVILDERGFAWFIDPFNNPIRAKTNLGQREGNIHSIDDAKRAVLVMLESSGR